MFKKPLVVFLTMLALLSLACGINIDLPDTQVKTGPTETTNVTVPRPEATGDLELTLAFGIGTLKVKPGAEGALVTGTATYNVADFKPEVKTNGASVRLEQGNLDLNGIPEFKDEVKNEWDLQLSSDPMVLHINAGAYSGKYELGGLAIKTLEVSDGAADVDLNFSEPNLTEMDVFRYNTGASNVSLDGLANSNASTFLFRSGAGNYKLHFNGELKRDMVVNIESGISTLAISIPEGVPALVTFEGAISNVDTYGTWKESSGGYEQPGSGPRITIIVKMGAGNLELRND